MNTREIKIARKYIDIATSAYPDMTILDWVAELATKRELPLDKRVRDNMRTYMIVDQDDFEYELSESILQLEVVRDLAKHNSQEGNTVVNSTL